MDKSGAYVSPGERERKTLIRPVNGATRYVSSVTPAATIGRLTGADLSGTGMLATRSASSAAAPARRTEMLSYLAVGRRG